MYKGKDFHLQIAGDRHVNLRLNEVDRFARWQRIAPPMPAGYGTYQYAPENLVDSIVFHENDTWLQRSHGQMVRQSAPAIMARNLPLPEVRAKGLAPYVLAAKFPNGAVAVATEGRVTPDSSWIHPKAHVTLREVEVDQLIGVFGYYDTLTLDFPQALPETFTVLAQDLLGDTAVDISAEITRTDHQISVPGALIETVGTSAGDPGDISAPGLVLKVVTD